MNATTLHFADNWPLVLKLVYNSMFGILCAAQWECPPFVDAAAAMLAGDELEMGSDGEADFISYIKVD